MPTVTPVNLSTTRQKIQDASTADLAALLALVSTCAHHPAEVNEASNRQKALDLINNLPGSAAKARDWLHVLADTQIYFFLIGKWAGLSLPEN